MVTIDCEYIKQATTTKMLWSLCRGVCWLRVVLRTPVMRVRKKMMIMLNDDSTLDWVSISLQWEASTPVDPVSLFADHIPFLFPNQT